MGDLTTPAERLRAQRPNHVWALDFQFDQTADGHVLKLLNVVVEFTREALVMQVKRSITADQTVTVLERLVAQRGAPSHIRCDNGPEMTAHALTDWCRSQSTATSYIDSGASWQNPFVESFHSRVRDELLNLELFSCLAEARVVIEDWRVDYNQNRRILRWARRLPPSSLPPGRYPHPRPDPRRADCAPTPHSGCSHPSFADQLGQRDAGAQPGSAIGRDAADLRPSTPTVANECVDRGLSSAELRTCLIGVARTWVGVLEGPGYVNYWAVPI